MPPYATVLHMLLDSFTTLVFMLQFIYWGYPVSKILYKCHRSSYTAGISLVLFSICYAFPYATVLNVLQLVYTTILHRHFRALCADALSAKPRRRSRTDSNPVLWHTASCATDQPRK